MKFDIYGPFDIPRGQRGLITDAKKFWSVLVDKLGKDQGKGLANAQGVYVFAIKSSRADRSRPWYVGKAEKTFKQEVFNAENIRKYNGQLDKVKRGKPLLFLLPEVTPTGRFKDTTKSDYTQALESMLMGKALEVNPKLLNFSNMQMLRKIEVDGFFNSKKRGPRTEPVEEFNKCFSK